MAGISDLVSVGQNIGRTLGQIASALSAFVLSPSGVTPGTYTNATVTVDVYGRVIAASSAPSDRRLKQHVDPITPEQAMRWLGQARPVAFQLDGHWTGGFVAQDEIAGGYPNGIWLEHERYVMDYASRIALLTATVQAMERRIRELEGRH